MLLEKFLASSLFSSDPIDTDGLRIDRGFIFQPNGNGESYRRHAITGDGISPRTLSERLHMLEQEGYVIRRSYPESPPRVEYELTEKGRALLPIIEAMRSFGRAWLVTPPQKRTRRLPAAR